LGKVRAGKTIGVDYSAVALGQRFKVGEQSLSVTALRKTSFFS
jgi:MOSC domain-containing protein YiiM